MEADEGEEEIDDFSLGDAIRLTQEEREREEQVN